MVDPRRQDDEDDEGEEDDDIGDASAEDDEVDSDVEGDVGDEDENESSRLDLDDDDDEHMRMVEGVRMAEEDSDELDLDDDDDEHMRMAEGVRMAEEDSDEDESSQYPSRASHHADNEAVPQPAPPAPASAEMQLKGTEAQLANARKEGHAALAAEVARLRKGLEGLTGPEASASGLGRVAPKRALPRAARSQEPTARVYPTWYIRLKRVQRAMLWYGMPITLLLICALVLMRDYEVHTFHVTPTLAANALRSVLLAAGHKEVAAPEQASVLWTDAAVHQTLTTSAVRTQRVNTLPGMVPARPDTACRALAEARAPLDRIVRVAECLVLPQQVDEVRAAIVRDGGRAMWELEPADATAYMMLDSAEAAGRPIPSLTNNPDALPQRGSWAVRRLDERPHLLGGRRFCIQLFVLVATEPLRVYVHSEGIVWRAARAWHAPVGPPETYAKGPRRFSTSAWQSGARDFAARLVPGELWPLTSLLRRLEDTEASPDSTADTDGQAKLKRADGSANVSATAAATLWGSLELASGAAAVASLSRQTGSGYRHPRTGSGFPGSHLYRSMMGYGEPLTPAAAAARGYAGAFQLLSVRLSSALDCLWMATNCN